MTHGGGGGGHSGGGHSGGHGHGGQNSQNNGPDFFGDGFQGGYFRRRGRWSTLGFVVIVIAGIIIRGIADHSSNNPTFDSVTINPNQLKHDEAALGMQVFSGSGDKVLGTVKITKPSDVELICEGCDGSGFTMTSTLGRDTISPLHIVDTGGVIATLRVAAGTYRDVRINTHGQMWNMTVTPTSD